MTFDILITNIKGLVQVREQALSFVAGKDMALLPVLENSFLAIKDGVIAAFGSMNMFDPLMRRSM